MKNILVLNGSPRRKGNTSALVKSFLDGARFNKSSCEEICLTDANLKFCQGCLRCNILAYCSLRDDDWKEISSKIEDADILVVATPIYFHHVSAQMKQLLDRFRSFMNIRITETGLIHTPWNKWEKHFVLLLCMGSSDDSDAKPVIDLFEAMIKMLGNNNSLSVIKATRLATAGQINKSAEELAELYSKLKLNPSLAKEDSERNKELLKEAYNLGKGLSI